jgi:hypothetical protein
MSLAMTTMGMDAYASATPGTMVLTRPLACPGAKLKRVGIGGEGCAPLVTHHDVPDLQGL